MNEIKFDYSILHEKASSLRTSASKLDAKFTEIKASANTVRNNFSGEAANQYFQSFDSFSARFSEFKDLVDRMATAVDNTANEMQTLESKIAGTVN